MAQHDTVIECFEQCNDKGQGIAVQDPGMFLIAIETEGDNLWSIRAERLTKYAAYLPHLQNLYHDLGDLFSHSATSFRGGTLVDNYQVFSHVASYSALVREAI